MLQQIPSNCFVKKVISNNILYPHSVDWNCPHCGRKVNFGFSWGFQGKPECLNTKSRCSGCGESVIFVYLGFDEETEGNTIGKLFIYPKTKTREPLSGIQSTTHFNNGLDKAYSSAVNVYNVQEWNATATMCRRLLEGIIKQNIPRDNQKKILAQNLKELPNHIDLQKPILTLAEAIKDGGNLGAHFDMEKEPDENIATLMMDLIEDLIEYIYILPNRVEELKQKIEKLSNNN